MIDLSIIIPAYNCEKTISRCLDSLVNQNVSKEIIVVNDGSTDGTLDILNKYANNYDFIKVITQENQGQSVARNHGLKIASGKYCFFCDSDDYIDKNLFDKLLPYINKNKVHIKIA